MMNRISHRGAMLAAIVVGLLSIVPSAHAHGGPGGRGGERRDPYAALSLTADQKTRIDAIRAQFESSTTTLRQQLDALREQMHTARQNDDQAAIEQLRTQAEPLHQQMRAQHEQMDQQVRAILTAEQIAKLDEMNANREKGGKHGGRRGGRGGQQGTGAAQGAQNGTTPSTGTTRLR